MNRGFIPILSALLITYRSLTCVKGENGGVRAINFMAINISSQISRDCSIICLHVNLVVSYFVGEFNAARKGWVLH